MNDKIVLVVEDNADDLELILRSFQKNNFTNKIVAARNGVEALDYLFLRAAYANREKNERPALILLDLKLPKLDGLEVLRHIRSDELTRTIPVVVLTTSNHDQDKMNSYELGANSYICKPVNFDQFVEATRQLGQYWLLLNEPPPSKAILKEQEVS